MRGMTITRNRDRNQPGHPTQFASPGHSEPEDSLALPVKHKLSETQQRVLESDLRLAETSDHAAMVSGHEYRTALSLAKKGLGHVRYQGPSLGWFTATSREHTGRAYATDLHQHGKNIAATCLTELGHTLIQNSRRDNHVITDDNGTLVCTTVSTRAGTQYGHPFDRVSADRIVWAREAAEEWAAANGRRGPIRVDAFGVVAPRDGSTPRVEHLKNIG